MALPQFKRKVNKKEIPVCNIMGVNIAVINMDWLLDYLDKNLKDLSGDYICVANVHQSQNPLGAFPQG